MEPCIAASGKDVCKLFKDGIRTIALTSDKRKALNISFGDKVTLMGGPCEGEYQVEDEMNIRYRVNNIMRDGFPIKGDIARYGNRDQCQGVYGIKK